VIHETHGDVCRLGYLRMIACLADDKEPKSLDFLSSQLYEITRQEKARRKGELTGVVSSMVNARNYVTLASEIGIIDRKTQTRGLYGLVYTRLESAGLINAIIDGREEASLDKLILLNPVERIFFLHILLQADYPFLNEIILWAIRQERFNRTTAMNYIMEEIYPEALSKSIQLVEGKKRALIRRDIEEARMFKERRLSFRSQAEWIRTRQYAKYRHIAPPRLEWLVDVGILNREGRGKFSVNQEVMKIAYEFERVLKMPLRKMREEMFLSIYPYLGKWSKAGQETIAKTLLEGYARFERNGIKRITLDMLELYTCFKLMEQGRITSPNTVHQVFNSLTIKYPDKVFITPSTGEVEIATIEIRELE